jgi:hypothetical protein
MNQVQLLAYALESATMVSHKQLHNSMGAPHVGNVKGG